VDERFTVFGAAGAVVFALLSGLLLARLTPANGGRPPMAGTQGSGHTNAGEP
jgi:hypothetical protein